MTDLAPVYYLPHGGGPMPLMDDPNHAGLIRFLKALPATFAKKPEAIVLISGHWEAAQPSVYAGKQHPMLFDYYGFPPATYEFKYPAPGAPELAQRIASLLQAAGLPCLPETQRGFDHGVFVPMLLINPMADIPCIQLSLLKGLNPAAHLRLGLALQELRKENVLILGSGMSFHNLQAVFAGEQPQLRAASDEFHHWLLDTLSNDKSPEERLAALAAWDKAPYAHFAHPRAEHLLPLHVCAGIAGGAQAQVVFDEVLMNHKVAGFSWH
ncbi:MAG: class III extradiol ring-cleavage dioxygenase [Pseudomonadota bacterium]